MGKIKEFLAKWDKAILFVVGMVASFVCSFIDTIEVCCLPVLVVGFLFEAAVTIIYCKKPNFVRYLATILGAIIVQLIVLL